MVSVAASHRRDGRLLLSSVRVIAAVAIFVIARGYRALLLTLIAVAVVPAVWNWHSFVVRSGSMEPNISVGDVVVASPLQRDEPVALGRVMILANPAQPYPAENLVHRVVEKREDGTFTTQGDANATPDTTLATRGSFRDTARVLVPYVGLPSLWLARGAVLELGAWAGLTCLAFYLARGPRRKPGKPVRFRRPSPRALASLTAGALVVGLVVIHPVDATFSGRTTSLGNSWTYPYDGTAPTGGSISYANGYVTALAVTITTTNGGDAGSGINALSTQVQRQAATLAGGVCGTFGAITNVGSPGSPSPLTDVSVRSGDCYRYQYLVTDYAGNTATYTSASVAKVDAVGPAHALTLSSPNFAFKNAATIFYKSNVAGSFAMADTPTDVGAGVGSVTFPAIATTGWTHSSQLDLTGPTYMSTTFSWTANPANPTGYVVSSLDAAGNQSTLAVPFAADLTAPSGGAVTYVNGYAGATSVLVSLANGTDSGSGVNTSSTQLQRATATLGTSTCGTFGSFANIGSAGPTSPYGDTSVITERCYMYRYVVADNVGNSTTYTSAAVAKVDTSTPAGSVIAPVTGSFVTGSIQVSSNSTDANSGVASAQFQTSPSGAGTWTNLGAADGTAPYAVTWNTVSGFPNGMYDVRVITTSNAGVTFTSAPNRVEVQNGAPTPTSVRLVNGPGDAGRIDQGDTIVATFSQSLHVNSICSAWPAGGDGADQSITGNNRIAVDVADGGASVDTLEVTSTTCRLNFGVISLGAGGFATGGNLSFGGPLASQSTFVWDQSLRTLTVILGAKTGPGSQGAVSTARSIYSPDPAITNAVGVAISGTFTTPDARQF